MATTYSKHNLTRAQTVYVGQGYNPGSPSLGYLTSIPSYQDCGAIEAANTTSVVSNQNATNNNFTLVSASVTFNVPRVVSIQSAQNLSTNNFTVYGKDKWGIAITETITGPNANTTYGKKAFAAVNNVAASGTATNVNIGWGNQIGLDYRVDYNTQVVVQMNGRLLSYYDAHVKVTNAATAENLAYILPTGGTATSLRVASTAGNANNNVTVTLLANGTTAGNAVVLSNYVANSVVSNTALTSVNFAPTDILRIQSSGGTNSSTAPLDVYIGIDPAALTAANTSTANATTGDVRGTINLGNAPDGTRRFVIKYDKLNANSDAGLFGVTQYPAT